MAHAQDTANESADTAERRRGWQFFLKASKWFALGTLGLIFLLIFTLIGHAPFIPTAVIMLIAVVVLGSIVH